MGPCVLGKAAVGTALPLLLLPRPWNARSICLHCGFCREHQQCLIQVLDPALGSLRDPRGPAPACLSGRTRQIPALMFWGDDDKQQRKGCPDWAVVDRNPVQRDPGSGRMRQD